ncbi:winged helix-turn-helix transcriptional regulator [Streptomyces sp. NPDC016675]|uniref:winged helix-turn-helix transcriptional regulator n=1 Tax=Streptomyces sp. NPDC016675 TaxID=3364970 RepID=UPI0037001E52
MAVEQTRNPTACKRVNDGIIQVFTVLGKRWNGPIVAVLMEQPTYYADLRRAIPGLSGRVLTDRLVELSAVGLVVREVEAGPPLRVRYRLTESGAALENAIEQLGMWGDKHLNRSR